MIKITSDKDLEQVIINDSNKMSNVIDNLDLSEIADKITNRARTNHRYTNRTGNLQRATKYQTVKSMAKIYIDETMAKYGSIIHDGSKYNPPDEFIDEAVEYYSKEIEDSIVKKIEEGLR